MNGQQVFLIPWSVSAPGGIWLFQLNLAQVFRLSVKQLYFWGRAVSGLHHSLKEERSETKKKIFFTVSFVFYFYYYKNAKINGECMLAFIYRFNM